MSRKKVLLTIISIAAIISLFAAARNHRISRKQPESDMALPSAFQEYSRIIERALIKDSSADISGTIRIYDEEKANTLKEQNRFHLIRSGNRYYSQISHQQSFASDSLLIQLDTLQKTVSVYRISPDIAKASDAALQSFEPFFSDTSGLRISGSISENGGLRTLQLHSDLNPSVKTCRLSYDTLTYRLLAAEVEFWKQQPLPGSASGNKIWLAKLTYQYDNVSNFDMTKMIRSIISITGTEVKLQPAYHDYALNSQL